MQHKHLYDNRISSYQENKHRINILRFQINQILRNYSQFLPYQQQLFQAPITQKQIQYQHIYMHRKPCSRQKMRNIDSQNSTHKYEKSIGFEYQKHKISPSNKSNYSQNQENKLKKGLFIYPDSDNSQSRQSYTKYSPYIHQNIQRGRSQPFLQRSQNKLMNNQRYQPKKINKQKKFQTYNTSSKKQEINYKELARDMQKQIQHLKALLQTQATQKKMYYGMAIQYKQTMQKVKQCLKEVKKSCDQLKDQSMVSRESQYIYQNENESKQKRYKEQIKKLEFELDQYVKKYNSGINKIHRKIGKAQYIIYNIRANVQR